MIGLVQKDCDNMMGPARKDRSCIFERTVAWSNVWNNCCELMWVHNSKGRGSAYQLSIQSSRFESGTYELILHSPLPKGLLVTSSAKKCELFAGVPTCLDSARSPKTQLRPETPSTVRRVENSTQPGGGV